MWAQTHTSLCKPKGWTAGPVQESRGQSDKQPSHCNKEIDQPGSSSLGPLFLLQNLLVFLGRCLSSFPTVLPSEFLALTSENGDFWAVGRCGPTHISAVLPTLTPRGSDSPQDVPAPFSPWFLQFPDAGKTETHKAWHFDHVCFCCVVNVGHSLGSGQWT